MCLLACGVLVVGVVYMSGKCRVVRGSRRKSDGDPVGTVRVRGMLEPDPSAPLPADVVPEDVPFGQLGAMRYVLNNRRSRDRTNGHKVCRKWLESNPSEFMRVYERLEREEAERRERERLLSGSSSAASSSAGAVSRSEVVEMDEGVERVLGLLRSFLEGRGSGGGDGVGK